MFWIYLTLVLLAYSFTRNVFWSVFLGAIASIVLVILGPIVRQPFSSCAGQGQLWAADGLSGGKGHRSIPLANRV